ncbi:MAG: serpin family protein [Candidatus Obscuribacterales bacterium]|nr:serpin family protein [Candidatus Obscuribacterales bacterium]
MFDDLRLIAPTAKFGINLLKGELGKAENKGKNVIVSPVSASLALGMTASGARGKTLAGMNQALGLDYDADSDGSNGTNDFAYSSLLSDLLAEDIGVTLQIANAIWARQGIEFNDSYLQKVGESFRADVKFADFSQEKKVLAAINGWVRDKTKAQPKDDAGKITQLLSEVNPLAVLYLLNALYFKGAWTTQFDKSQTKDATFHAAEGDKQHPLMYRFGQMRYSSNKDYEMVALPFGKTAGRVYLYVMLPKGKKTVDDIVGALDGEAFFSDAAGDLSESQGHLWLPRFKLEYSAKLNENLKALGMEEAFSDAADFSGMRKENNLKISNVVHKVVCSFDEEGGEVAAATAVEVSVRGAVEPALPWQMRVDRPFVAILADDDTGAFIAAGAVRNP